MSKSPRYNHNKILYNVLSCKNSKRIKLVKKYIRCHRCGKFFFWSMYSVKVAKIQSKSMMANSQKFSYVKAIVKPKCKLCYPDVNINYLHTYC